MDEFVEKELKDREEQQVTKFIQQQEWKKKRNNVLSSLIPLIISVITVYSFGVFRFVSQLSVVILLLYGYFVCTQIIFVEQKKTLEHRWRITGFCVGLLLGILIGVFLDDYLELHRHIYRHFGISQSIPIGMLVLGTLSGLFGYILGKGLDPVLYEGPK